MIGYYVQLFEYPSSSKIFSKETDADQYAEKMSDGDNDYCIIGFDLVTTEDLAEFIEDHIIE